MNDCYTNEHYIKELEREITSALYWQMSAVQDLQDGYISGAARKLSYAAQCMIDAAQDDTRRYYTDEQKRDKCPNLGALLKRAAKTAKARLDADSKD